MLVVRSSVTGQAIDVAEASIRTALEDGASVFSASTHDNLSTTADGEVTVDSEGVRRFTGFLERTPGAAAEGFELTARSRPIQLARIDALGNERFAETTLAGVLTQFAGEADVLLGPIPDRKVKKFRLCRSESYLSELQRLAEILQVTLTDDSAGKLRVFALDDDVEPTETWIDGQGDVTEEIVQSVDYSEWRREWVCRGVSVALAADVEAGDRPIRIDTLAGSTRIGRKVLPNRAATSHDDAAALLDWAAKTALAKTISLTVVRGKWDADPGDLRTVRAPALRIDEAMIVAAIDANLTDSRYSYEMVFPDVYRARRKLRQNLATRPAEWTA